MEVTQKVPHKDQKYIEALKNNDPVLIEEIYQKHSPSIIAFVRKNSGTIDEAQDIFQEVLISLFQQSKNGFVLTCPLNAFLYVACRNRWYNKLKESSKRVTILESEGFKNIETSTSIVTAYETDELQRQLFMDQFNKLGPSCRELLGLSWTRNEQTGKLNSLKEVAEMTDRSYNYVRKKIVECREKLIALGKEAMQGKF